MTRLTRRRFLMSTGALYVTFRIGGAAAQAPARAALPESLAADPDIDSWIRIGADDSVTVFSGKVELGQGLKTALVQIAAEELEVAPETVEVITADTERTPDEGYTAGSRSIELSGMAIRQAAAETRAIVLELAAEHLGAAADTLQARGGRITGDHGRSVRYGELVDGRTLGRRAQGQAAPKTSDQHRVVGRSLPRVDLPAKVFGAESFIQDLRLEGMLHARIVHPPGQHARLAELADTAEVEQMPGVRRVVRDGSLLGVIAEREEQAIAAAQRLAELARWRTQNREMPDEDSLEAYLRNGQAEHSVLAERGQGGDGRRLQASYMRPFQAHASIGPSCAVAVMEDDELTVWTHSQGVYPLREDMSRVLGMPEAAIHLVHRENAGCYGHNGADDAALEAAWLARAVPGRPVRLQWSRADEFHWEPMGAAMVVDCEAALDDDGRIVDWRSTVRGYPHPGRPGFGAGDGANLFPAQLMEDGLPPRGTASIGLGRNAVPLYDFASLHVDQDFVADSPIRVSSLRALGGYANVFALESFMDELAAAAGADPVEFRVAHLADARARAVVEAAADAAGWRQRPQSQDGRGYGIAFAQYNNAAAYCAVIAEVSVSADGEVRVHRVWSATDCGQIVNPDGVRNQIAGGAIQSASWTLQESVPLNDTGVDASDWQDYPILRFPEAPEVEVVLIDRPEQPPVGTGEASQGPTAAAIANAVYAAAGARVRRLPLTPARVAAARG